MAIVVRRYSFAGPSALDLSRFVGHGAVPSALYPAPISIDIQIDDAAPGTADTLDTMMSSIGWVYDPAAPNPPIWGALGINNVWTKQQQASPVALVYGANVAIDATAGDVFELALTGATAQLDDPSGLVKGQSFMIAVAQDATGGRGLTFGSKYSFGLAGAPNFTTSTANKVDLISCYVYSTTKILCSVLRGF